MVFYGRISLLINAWEGRDVATADVVGAYLNAYMEDFVIVKLVGDEVDIISKLNPVYKEYVISENGKKVLYLQLIKEQRRSKGLIANIDAEFVGDQDNRRSVIRRIIYLNDAPVGWNLKAMSRVTLSSTKAEYVLISEGLKDLKFIYMCLKYLK